MPRILTFAVCFLGTALALVSSTFIGCTDVLEGTTTSDAGNLRRDSAPVDPVESGPALDGATSPPPSCAKYCDLVTTNCTNERAQYASKDDCLAFCAHLPLQKAAGQLEETNAESVACRQYWADSPARTSPSGFCLTAGPFGGNTCGDRCTAFCDVVLSACPPDGGVAVYANQPECASDCANFSYRDAGTDGGGESPTGPTHGDSLNCRLYHLRAATVDASACSNLRPLDGSCTH